MTSPVVAAVEAPEPPASPLWVGRHLDYPLDVFENEEDAASWLAADYPTGHRRLWRLVGGRRVEVAAVSALRDLP